MQQDLSPREEKSSVLKPDDDDSKGNTGKDALKSKQPRQAESSPEAFVDCEVLPVLIDIDVTGSYVHKVAKLFQVLLELGALIHNNGNPYY